MKLTKQLGLILFSLFLGSIFRQIFPFPIPSNVYGMVIMFVFLKIKLISLKSVEETADILLKYMGLFLIPVVASLINNMDKALNNILIVLIVLIITNIITIVATGYAVQFIQRRILKNGF